MQIPAQTYLVFKPKPGVDFEFYDEGFRPGQAGATVDFYVPVEDEARTRAFPAA